MKYIKKRVAIATLFLWIIVIIIFMNIHFNNIKIVKNSILHQPIQKTLINK